MALNRVVICGVNTARLPLLTDKEKDELFDRIEQGDMAARETFIKGNLRLVLSVIQRFSNSNENPDDLFQVGCIGLIKAIDNFDRSLNVKFSTYAVPMILGECRRYLRDNNSIRVSRSLRDIAYKAIYTKDALLKKLDREPTVDEIAKEIDVAPEENISLKEAMKKLNEREYNILRLRFFEGKTQTEVASEIAISQAQVSRIEKSAIKSLKGYLR